MGSHVLLDVADMEGAGMTRAPIVKDMNDLLKAFSENRKTIRIVTEDARDAVAHISFGLSTILAHKAVFDIKRDGAFMVMMESISEYASIAFRGRYTVVDVEDEDGCFKCTVRS